MVLPIKYDLPCYEDETEIMEKRMEKSFGLFG
jgi:hypothetical protein